MTARDLSLAALSVLELSPLEMVEVAAGAGYSHIGLRLVPVTSDEPAWPIVGDTPMVRGVLRRLGETGLRVLDVEVFRLLPDTRLADFEPALATGARLGARYALVGGADPDEARTIDRFAAFCELAGRHGLGACLEPMPWADVRDIAQAARIVDAAGSANGNVLVDAIHFDRSGGTLADLARIPPSRLPYLQLCDAPAERPASLDEVRRCARTERLPPGEGGLDLVGLLRAMPEGIPVAIEAPMHALARTMPALERATMLLDATRELLAEVDDSRMR